MTDGYSIEIAFTTNLPHRSYPFRPMPTSCQTAKRAFGFPHFPFTPLKAWDEEVGQERGVLWVNLEKLCCKFNLVFLNAGSGR
jgi:hypothetical protein